MSLVNFKRRAEAVHYEGEVFEKLDLRSMKAFGSTWKNCLFRDCQMGLARWQASRFEDCQFTRCEMPLVDLSTSFFDDTHFRECNMEQASFMGSHFRDVSFHNCRIVYGDTTFQDATMKEKVVFFASNLHGANLDFREVAPGALEFKACNLWGVKLGMACEFWNSKVDDRTVRQFLALVARVADDPRIAELAGDQYRIVQRAMDGGDKCRSTKASATTSTPIPNYPEATATTRIPITTPAMTMTGPE